MLERGRQLLREVEDLQRLLYRIDKGWESEFRIALDTMIPIEGIISYTAAFYGEHRATRIHFLTEALGGTWDALYTRRADLVVGALGQPPFIGYALREIDTLETGLYVAPSHPLADGREPVTTADLCKYRAVTIQDTSRQLPRRYPHLSEGQETTSVSSMDGMLKFLLAGLGVGYLPACVARPYIEKGLLVGKKMDTALCPQTFYLAWHPEDAGEALKWWIHQLEVPNLISRIWASIRL
jgi:DNA-binding transcriptional LysR family regulator